MKRTTEEAGLKAAAGGDEDGLDRLGLFNEAEPAEFDVMPCAADAQDFFRLALGYTCCGIGLSRPPPQATAWPFGPSPRPPLSLAMACPRQPSEP